MNVVGGRDERGLLIIEMEKTSLSDGSSQRHRTTAVGSGYVFSGKWECGKRGVVSGGGGGEW